MKKYEEKIKEAEEEIEMADHLIYVTSPVVKDKNILSKAFDHVYESFRKAIRGFLLYKRRQKKIFSIPKDNRLEVEVFLKKFGEELGIKENEWQDYLELNKIGEKKEKGKYTLMKEDSLHFVLEKYNTTKIEVDDIKDKLLMMKDLINKIKGNAE